MNELLKKCLVEFIGTFFLVLTIGCCVYSPAQGIIAPLAIGFVLMVMVYAGGYISGGHYNPAVSLACFVRGVLSAKDMLFYWISQLVAAVVATVVVKQLVFVPATNPATFNLCQLMTCELLFTFALCYVVLHTATSKETEGNSYYGLAIGSTVMVGAFATSGLCFGAFNPAVAIGLLTMGAAAKLIGLTSGINLIGGILAGVVYKLTAK